MLSTFNIAAAQSIKPNTFNNFINYNDYDFNFLDNNPNLNENDKEKIKLLILDIAKNTKVAGLEVPVKEIAVATEVVAEMGTYVKAKGIQVATTGFVSRNGVAFWTKLMYKKAALTVAKLLATPAAPYIITFLLAAGGIYVMSYLIAKNNDSQKGYDEALEVWEDSRVPQIGHLEKYEILDEFINYTTDEVMNIDLDIFPNLNTGNRRVYNYLHTWGSWFEVPAKAKNGKQLAIFENQSDMNIQINIDSNYVEYNYAWGAVETIQQIYIKGIDDHYIEFKSWKRLSPTQFSDGISTDIICKIKQLKGQGFITIAELTIGDTQRIDNTDNQDINSAGYRFMEFNKKIKEIFGHGFLIYSYTNGGVGPTGFIPGRSLADTSFCVPGDFYIGDKFKHPLITVKPQKYPIVFPPKVFENDNKIESEKDFNENHTTDNIVSNIDKRPTITIPGVIPKPVPPEELYPELEKPVYPERPTIDPSPEPDPNPDPNPNPNPNPEIPKLDFKPLYADLSKKFPFCIPFDLINWIKILDAQAKQPIFEVNFSGNAFMKYSKVKQDTIMVLDFTQYQLFFNIIRLFVLISFIVSLIILTKNIIK